MPWRSSGRRRDQHAVDDRRAAVVVDALVAHRRQDRARLDLAQADVRAAEQRHRPREAPAVAVEHRQRPQVAREVRHRPGRRVAHRVQVGAAMVGDDAFRVAGGARRVRDRDRVPLVGRAAERRQRRMGGEQRLVLVRAEPIAGARVFAVADVDDDRPAPVRLGQDAKRRADRRRELAVGDQHLALAVIELPGDERGVEAGVERVEDRVQGRHRVVRLDHLGRVVKHRADGRAASDAERAQRRRQPRRTIARLAPGVAALPVDDGLEVAEDLGAALDEAGRRERDEIRRGLVQSLLVDVHGRSPVTRRHCLAAGNKEGHGKTRVLGSEDAAIPWPATRSWRRAPGRCPRGCRRRARGRPRSAPCPAARRRPAAALRRAGGASSMPDG